MLCCRHELLDKGHEPLPYADSQYDEGDERKTDEQHDDDAKTRAGVTGVGADGARGVCFVHSGDEGGPVGGHGAPWIWRAARWRGR